MLPKVAAQALPSSQCLQRLPHLGDVGGPNEGEQAVFVHCEAGLLVEECKPFVGATHDIGEREHRDIQRRCAAHFDYQPVRRRAAALSMGHGLCALKISGVATGGWCTSRDLDAGDPFPYT